LAADSTLAGGKNPGLAAALLATFTMFLAPPSAPLSSFTLASARFSRWRSPLLGGKTAFAAYRFSSSSEAWTVGAEPSIEIGED